MPQFVVKLRREDRIAIMDKKAVLALIRHRFANLLQGPIRGGVSGHIAVQNPTRSQF
jgi:hypothetical protein